MKNNALLLPALMLASLTACGQKSEPSNLGELPYRIELPAKADSSRLHYSDLYSEVEYIPLDSPSDDAIINYFTQLKLTSDNELLVFDSDRKSVLRFDAEGHYLNRIGDHGHASNEYTDPTSIAFDPYNNHVLVRDDNPSRVLSYSLDGKFVQSMEVPVLSNYTNTPHVEMLDQDHLLFHCQYMSSSLPFNYVIMDRNGAVCDTFELYHDVGFVGVIPYSNYMYMWPSEDGGMYCRSYWNNTIYKAQGEHAVPFIEFTNKDWSFSDTEGFKDLADKRNFFKTQFSWITVAGGKLMCVAYTTDGSYVYCNDLHGKVMSGADFFNDIKGVVVSCDLEAVKGNKLYFLLYPRDFEDLDNWWNNNPERAPKDDLRTFVRQMAQQINPIIQVCTVK